MNLPKFEPIEWRPAEHIEPRQQQPQARAYCAEVIKLDESDRAIQFMPLAEPPDLRRDVIGADGLLHIYYPEMN